MTMKRIGRPEIGDVFTWTGAKGAWTSPRVRPTFQLHGPSIIPTLMTNLLLAGDDVNNGILIGWITDDYYVRGVSGGTTQFELRASDGKAYAGGGKVVLDASGITLTAETAGFVAGSALKWGVLGHIWVKDPGATLGGLYIGRGAQGSETELITLLAGASGGSSYSKIILNVDSGADFGWVEISDDLQVGLDVRIAGGLYVGSAATDPDADDIHFDGNLKSMKNSTFYDVYGYVPLATHLTSTSFAGDSFSTTAKTKIDLSAAFSGCPAGIKAVNMHVQCRDSASATSTTRVILSPDDTAGTGQEVAPAGRQDNFSEHGDVIVTCDASGDIYYQIVATGANTFDLWITIWGYYI